MFTFEEKTTVTGVLENFHGKLFKQA